MNRFVRSVLPAGSRNVTPGTPALALPSAATLQSVVESFAVNARFSPGETVFGSLSERRKTFVTSCKVLAEDILRLHDKGIRFSDDPIKLAVFARGLHSSDDFSTSAVSAGEIFNIVSRGVGISRIIFGNSFELWEHISSFCSERRLEIPHVQNPMNLSETTKALVQLRREGSIRDEDMGVLLSPVRSDIFSEANALFREALAITRSGSGELQPLVHLLSTRSGQGAADACITLCVIAAFCADYESRLPATEHLLSLMKSPSIGVSLTAYVLLMDLHQYSNYGDVRRYLIDAGFEKGYFDVLLTKEHPQSKLHPAVKEIHDQKRGFATRVIGGERKIVNGKPRIVGGTSKTVNLEYDQAFGKFD